MTDQEPRVPLKEHIETQIAWLDRHVKSQLEAIDVSTAKALSTLDKRLEGMNEFRGTIKDLTATLVTRAENDAQQQAIETRLKSMELARASGEGKMLVVSGIVAFVAALLVSLISHWLAK